MKRSLPILLLGLFSLFFGSLSAQNSALCFVQPRHDFGTIAEDGGVVSHTFVASNSSNEPVVILGVAVGCSCTKADFSRQPILPQKSSELTVRFEPMGQPSGQFVRKVIVNTSQGNIPLTIMGDITPRKKSIAEQYPLIAYNGVRLESNSHAFGYVEHGVAAMSSIGIINTSDKAVKIEIVQREGSGELKIHYPQRLLPKERGEINFGYDIGKSSDLYGSIREVLQLYIDGNLSRYEIIINAIAIDSIEKSDNKEWQTIQLSENFIKFGTLKRTSKRVYRTIDITNIGLEPLIIRKIENGKGLFDVRLVGSNHLQSDQKSSLEVSFDPSQSDFGAVVDRITIISNDPRQPAKSFKVSAIVEN